MIRYLALLRGINVGGNNIIKMADLKRCFQDLGLKDVVTYIQSGNVLFMSADKNRSKMEDGIEQSLSKRFNYKSRVVLVTDKDLKKMVEAAPKGFGKSPDKYRYDVIFLKEPMTPKEAMKSITPREGVDTADAGKGAIYISRLIAKAGQSYLSKVVQTKAYQFMTIRNWNTTTKLLAIAYGDRKA